MPPQEENGMSDIDINQLVVGMFSVMAGDKRTLILTSIPFIEPTLEQYRQSVVEMNAACPEHCYVVPAHNDELEGISTPMSFVMFVNTEKYVNEDRSVLETCISEDGRHNPEAYGLTAHFVDKFCKE